LFIAFTLYLSAEGAILIFFPSAGFLFCHFAFCTLVRHSRLGRRRIDFLFAFLSALRYPLPTIETARLTSIEHRLSAVAASAKVEVSSINPPIHQSTNPLIHYFYLSCANLIPAPAKIRLFCELFSFL
jgi:hypothetical protein